MIKERQQHHKGKTHSLLQNVWLLGRWAGYCPASDWTCQTCCCNHGGVALRRVTPAWDHLCCAAQRGLCQVWAWCVASSSLLRAPQSYQAPLKQPYQAQQQHAAPAWSACAQPCCSAAAKSTCMIWMQLAEFDPGVSSVLQQHRGLGWSRTSAGCRCPRKCEPMLVCGVAHS